MKRSEHSKYLRNQQKPTIKGLCASYGNEKCSSVTSAYAKYLCSFFPGIMCKMKIGQEQIADENIWSNNFSLRLKDALEPYSP